MTESNMVVYDESELGLSSSDSIECKTSENARNGDGESVEKVTIRKKIVSFNKQVIRNVFNPGSTVLGMKKTKSIRNKASKIKRTISDPTSNGKNDQDLTDFLIEPKTTLRNRTFYESSDDFTNALGDSSEKLLKKSKNLYSIKTYNK